MTGPIIGTGTGHIGRLLHPEGSTKALPNYLPYSIQYCPFNPSFTVGVLCWCSKMQYHTERGRESRREVRLIRPSAPIMSSLVTVKGFRGLGHFCLVTVYDQLANCC
jgi:hypothetical protein